MNKNTLRPLDSIDSAISDLKAGKMIIVVDSEDRENEGDFVMAAEFITPEAVNFMATVGRGLICTPLSAELAKKYELKLQVEDNTASLGTAFTVTIDARDKISTGISASDRAHTIKLLASPETTARDFVRPGHIFPLIAKKGGVLERPGHTEAAVDLAKLSGGSSVGVICEIMNPDGSMARYPHLCEMAEKYQLKMISIEQLIEYRKKKEESESLFERIPLSTRYGDFEFYIFRFKNSDEEHLALVKGDPDHLALEKTLLRLHSECFTGDVFGSQRCDCGDQLLESMKMIEQEGRGLIIYLRQEGRGIGLWNKIKAYQLQDQGLDTVDANLHLGFPADSRDYAVAHQILRHFNVTDVKLLTNNPLKLEALKKMGLKNVERISLEVGVHKKNAAYLLTKKTKLGHLLNHLIHPN